MKNIFNCRKVNKDFAKSSIKKIVRAFSLFLMVGLIIPALTGCKTQEKIDTNTNANTNTDTITETDDNFYYSFIDSLDNEVNLEDKPERVVSLVGSYAETWILAGGSLVGVTNDVISERGMDLPSDTNIVGTIKEPNVEEVIALSSDFVLLSPDVESHIQIAETLRLSMIPHAFFKVEHFEDYLDMLKICTDITGNQELYEENGLAVKKQIDDVLSKANNENEIEILFIRAFSSGAKAKYDDNMACKILEDLGTVNMASKHESLLEELSIEEIIEEDPEFIFVVTMGNSEKAIQALKEGIEKNPAWSGLSAVKNDRYIVLPKELFHYKPNARWGESYEFIAKILYPNDFQ